LKPTIILWAVVGLMVILSACDSGEPESSDTDQSTADNPQGQNIDDSSGNVTSGITYDPGPYFTPQRERPQNPAGFNPPAELGNFTRVISRGSCISAQGQTSHYATEDFQTVVLTCRYFSSASQARLEIERLGNSRMFASPPIFMELQGEKSFVLGETGEGFIYAWTHSNWLFIAHSLTGREPLDAFMAEFPY